MSGKGVKWPLGWTLVAENIENVARVKLDPKVQRELGCSVGEHVFLEYPWAYVPRDTVAKLASLPESSLAPFKENIEAYESDMLLVGYSSTRLTSDDFVICLTEAAKCQVLERNRAIAKALESKAVGMVRKAAKPWNSLGSESDVNETFAILGRGFFEIEIVLPGRRLGSTRTLRDRDSSGSRDSYAELRNTDEEFENVDRKCACGTAQTHLQPRQTFVQTYPGYPRNAWTQYAYADALNEEPVDEDPEQEEENEDSERNDERSERSKEENVQVEEGDDAPKEKTPLELFLEARSGEMIDAIEYNAAVNLQVDDIRSLSRGECNAKAVVEAPAFCERFSFASLDLATNKSVYDVSLHPRLPEYLAISYVTDPTGSFGGNESINEHEFQPRVLVWKLDEPLRPRLQLQDHREVYSVSFCPHDDGIVIGGCSTGQVVAWNVKDCLTSEKRNRKDGPPMFRAILVSNRHRSHRLPVRTIRWMPDEYRIEPGGRLTKSSRASAQFLTASEDGVVAVWSLFNLDDVDDAFQPVCRLRIRASNDDQSRNIAVLSLCLPSISVLEERDESGRETGELNSKQMDYMKSLWIGCPEGLIKCRWEGQVFDERRSEDVECEISSRSCVHDGPVTEITRSPHLRDVLLTIGGHVFAIWKDDYVDTPLFRRRTGRSYTACCWASEPGVFVLGCQDGALEIWDIKNRASEPTVSQTVASKSIVVLLPGTSNAILVGDRSGCVRAIEEPEIFFRKDDSLGRMDWFEEYAWRESRRKKVFAGWQNDFLVSDPAAIAKRSATRDEERKREVEEARERLRREQQDRIKLQTEKRVRPARKPKHELWRAKELERMKAVLLEKKSLVPSELERNRLPLVVSRADRDAKLQKARDKIENRESCYLQALSREFPELVDSTSQISKTVDPIPLARSVDECVQTFCEIRDRAREMLAKRNLSPKSEENW